MSYMATCTSFSIGRLWPFLWQCVCRAFSTTALHTNIKPVHIVHC